MPVYGSLRVPYEKLAIGQRLRAARQRRGLTLRDLAAQTKLSTAVLSQLENGRRPADVRQALSIAGALGLTIDVLLSDEQTLPYQIVRDEELRASPPQRIQLLSQTSAPVWHPNQFRARAGLFAGRHLEPVRGQILPAAPDSEVSYSFHHEQAFLLVIRGRVEFGMKTPDGIERLELAAGDSLYFWSNLPHYTRSLDAHEAETLELFASAPGSLSFQSPWLVAPRAEFEVDSEDRLKVIGRRIRRCRAAAEQSVAEIAPLIGVSTHRLEMAESGRRPLPLSAMVRFAQLFGYPLHEFMVEGTPPSPYCVVQRASGVTSIPPVSRYGPTSPGNIFRRLNGGFPSPLMFPYLIQVPTSDEVATPHTHHGEEFLYVLSGQLELVIGSGDAVHVETLHAGDSCYLDATVPHMLRGRPLNPYDRLSAEVLDLFWCPLGEKYLFGPGD